MARLIPFKMDGEAYNVDVIELTRKFSVLDSEKSGRTQDGKMYRDPIGTYYNYTMTVMRRGNDVDALDDFWEAISAPKESHKCTFPYGQDMLTQEMYVTSGEQKLRRMTKERNEWDEISVSFVAMEPEVVP